MTVTEKPALTVDGVVVKYGRVTVLDDVTFQAGRGVLMGVVGPNGAGKSTLFDVIAGLLPVSSGRIEALGMSNDGPASIAYVPQREKVNWRFPVTVLDVVTLGRAGRPRWIGRSGSGDRELARLCLERVDMWRHRSDLLTELSGGQRQRVFVARALAQEADLLLLDEAFSGVDVGAQEGLVGVLRTLRDEGRTVLMATHDLTNLAERFDQVLCINSHVCACGPPTVAFTPEVLEELYGAHGVDFTGDGVGHRGHPD